jgi:predicted aminopeptidase
LPGFHALLLQEKTFPRFYAAVRKLSQLPQVERQARLFQLGQPLTDSATSVAAKPADAAGAQ